MDIHEFVTKMAAQHGNLLKVIELQNQSIQTLNHRLNALAASQLVVFALLLEFNQTDRRKVAYHLRAMLENPHITGNQHLVNQLKELLEVCEEEVKSHQHPSKALPKWFKGVVQGGLSDPLDAQKDKN